MPGFLASNIRATMLVRSSRVGLPHHIIFSVVVVAPPAPPAPPSPPEPPVDPPFPPEPPVRAPPVATAPPVFSSSMPPVLPVFFFRLGEEQATQPATATRAAAAQTPFRRFMAVMLTKGTENGPNNFRASNDETRCFLVQFSFRGPACTWCASRRAHGHRPDGGHHPDPVGGAAGPG